MAVKRLVDAKKLDIKAAGQVEHLTNELTYIATTIETRFIHGDIHPMNIMCSADGQLLAFLDWGDAGWGDPTLDFAAIPCDAIGSALEGYKAEAPGSLGKFPQARIAWNKLLDAMDDLWDTPGRPLDLDTLQRFMRSSTSQSAG